jgi:hypothetical protein
MPRIPRMSSPTPRVAAPEMGAAPRMKQNTATYEAINQAGAALQNFSLNLVEKRTQAETNDFINSADNQFEADSYKKKIELQNKYSGDPKGYSTEFDSWAKDWNKNKIKEAPNTIAKDNWSRAFTNKATSASVDAQSYERKQAANFMVGKIDGYSQEHANNLTLSPNPEYAMSSWETTVKSVKDNVGIHWNETEAEELLKKLGARQAEGYLNGLERNKNFGSGLSFIDGKDKETKELLKYVDQDKLQSTRNRFMNAMEVNNEVSKQTINKTINNAVLGAIKYGGITKSEEFNQAYKLAEYLPPDKKALTIDDLDTAKYYAEKIALIKTMTPEKAIAEIKSKQFPDESFNLQGRMNLTSQFIKTAEEIIQQKESGAGEFYINNDKEVGIKSQEALDLSRPQALKSYIDEIDVRTDAEKITNKSYLSAAMAESYTTMLTTKDPVVSEQSFQALSAGAGDKTSVIINELRQKNKNFTDLHAAAFSIGDSKNRISVLSNLKNKQAIEDNPRVTSSSKQLKEAMLNNDSIANFSKIINNSDPSGNRMWIGNGATKLIELEAKSIIASGGDPDEAVSMASKKVIEDNFDFAEAGKSSLIVPKNLGIDKDDLENAIQRLGTKDYLSKLDITVPSVYPDKNRLLEDYEDKGYFISTPDQSGAYMVLKNSSNQHVPLRDSKGTPIRFNYSDMIKESQDTVKKSYSPRGF